MSVRRSFVAIIALAFLAGLSLESLNAQTLRNHWTFDGSIDDEEGGNHAMGDEPPFVSGFDCAPEGAASFDGNRTIAIDNSGASQLPIDFTISAWVRLTENGPSGANFFQGAGIYFGEVTGFTADAGFVIIDDHAVFGIGGAAADTTIFGTTGIVDGQWHHVAAVRDTTAGAVGDSTLRVYVDGVLDAQGIANYDGPVSATPQFVVGNNLVGDLDELQVYDGVLGAQAIFFLAADPKKADPTLISRSLSTGTLPGGESLTVVVTASNTAASGGSVVVTESIGGLGITASSSIGGVVVDNDANTVTITFDADGSKGYVLAADAEGCGPGSVTLSGNAVGSCVVQPLETTLACPGDLVSHYPFDGDLVDVAGGLEGQLTGTGGPVFVNGARNQPGDQALAFSNDYGVDINNVAPNEFTISCWIRMDESQNGFFPDGSVWWQGHAILQGEVAGDVADAGLTMVGDVALFGIGGPDRTVRGQTSLVDGEWHLLTATRSIVLFQSELRLYVDGELDAEGVAPNAGSVDRHAVWGVGRQAQNRGLTGEIDDVRIYSRALSDTEIGELFSGCSDNASFARELSESKLGGGDSIDVTVSATNVAAAGGSVTLTDTIPAAVTASSSDDGVVVNNGTVTLTFDADGAKSYTLTADAEGCGPGSAAITGTVDGGCAVPPSSTNIICLGGLLSHFPLDGTLEDIVGGLDGILSGAGGPQYTDGVSEDGGDEALRFNNDYGVDINNIAPNDFTLSLWVRMAAPQADPCCGGAAFWMGHALFQGETTGDVDDSALTVLTDVASFGIGNPDTTITGTTTLADSEWHHIVATRFINTDNGLSDLRLYVDGGVDAEGSALNLGALTANSVWGLGRQAQNRGLVGDIDDVRIYGRALSQEEVQDIFTGCEGVRVSLSRELSAARLDGGDSTVVTVTASNVAVAGGPVTLTDTIPAGLTPSSSDNGVDVDGDQVTLTFDADGSKSYTLTADGGGCPVGSTLGGVVSGNCTVRPDGTRLICTGDLVAHYPFDGSVDDAVSGSTPNLSGTEVPSFVSGVTGAADQALRFANDYGVDVPNIVPDDFTLSCFVRMDAAQADPCCGDVFWSGHALFQGETTGNVNDSALTVLTDVATFGIGNPDTTIKGTTSLADGDWHLVTATRSINTVTGLSDLVLYVDGEIDASDVAPNRGPLISNAVWGVGRQAQNRGIVGEIDDVRIYARALSQEEVRALLPDDGPVFRRGDHDGSGIVDLTDPLNLLGFLFLGTTPPICADASDGDNSAALDISDALNLLGFLFLGNFPLNETLPGPSNCGPDPDVLIDPDGEGGFPPQPATSLGCDTYPSATGTACP